ncbi:MAG: rRNA maturation RNase YbeY, partial [Candidatus Binatia bacterium]
MSVEITSKVAGKRILVHKIRKKAERILKLLNQNQAELSLALVENREIQELNARYRSKNEPTDVLSFPSGGILPKGEKLLGDVVISIEQAERQARKRGKRLDEEVEALLIHGILHLLGYDHERSPKEAKIMGGMEKKVRRGL